MRVFLVQLSRQSDHKLIIWLHLNVANIGDLGLFITHNLNIDGTVALPVVKQLSIFSTWVLNGNVSTVNSSYNSFSV